MKLITFLRITYATLLMVISANAAIPIQIGAGGVYKFDSDYLDRSWGTGFTIGVGSFIEIRKNLFINSELNYYRLPLKNKFTALTISRVKGGLTDIFDLTLNFKARLYPSEYQNSPYMIMGVGMMYKMQDKIEYMHYSRAETEESENEFCPTYDFGFGFDLTSRSNKGVFIEARFVFGFFKDHKTGFFPIKLGILF